MCVYPCTHRHTFSFQDFSNRLDCTYSHPLRGTAFIDVCDKDMIDNGAVDGQCMNCYTL